MNSSLKTWTQRLTAFTWLPVILAFLILLSFYYGNTGYILPLVASTMWWVASLWLVLAGKVNKLTPQWSWLTITTLGMARALAAAVIIGYSLVMVMTPETQALSQLTSFDMLNIALLVALSYYLADLMFVSNRFKVTERTIVQLGDHSLLPGDKFKVGPFRYPDTLQIFTEDQELRAIKITVECKDGLITIELHVQLKLLIGNLKLLRQHQEQFGTWLKNSQVYGLNIPKALEDKRNQILGMLMGKHDKSLVEVLQSIALNQYEITDGCPIVLTKLTTISTTPPTSS